MTDPAGHSRARAKLLEICERIRNGTPVNHACALEDVPRSSFYALREADPEAEFAVAKAIAHWSESERLRIEDALNAGDPKTANVRIHRIGIRDPENYAPPPKRQEVSGPGGSAIEQKHSGEVKVVGELVRIARSAKEAK